MTHRYDRIAELCTEGKTFQEIADALGVSRQRAYQLVHHAKGRELGLPAIREEAARERSNKQEVELRKALTRRERFGVSMSQKEFMADVLRAEQHHRLMQKKANSRAAGVAFDLSWGDVEWPSLCPVLGIPIDYFAAAGARNEASCSFDRLDSTRGYIRGNVRIVSWRANRIKNDGTAEEHRRIAEYIDRCSERQ